MSIKENVLRVLNPILWKLGKDAFYIETESGTAQEAAQIAKAQGHIFKFIVIKQSGLAYSHTHEYRIQKSKRGENKYIFIIQREFNEN